MAADCGREGVVGQTKHLALTPPQRHPPIERRDEVGLG